MAYIEINNVSKGFGSGTARSEILKNINLHINQGELVAILGYSGVGKSTLMNLIAGLEEPDSGEIIVDGKKIDGPHPDRGLVFQNYSLLPWLSVYGNVAMAVNQIYRGSKRSERKSMIKKAIERVNLDDASYKKPGELSGGMRQRNSVARTLSMNPKLLLLDEPLSALDALTRSVIQDQILEIKKAEGQTVILITNDVDEGLYMADKIIPLSIGPEASLGPEIYNSNPYPRDRKAINSSADYQKLRHEIISFLLNEKEKEKASSPNGRVTLPNIKPIDISRHKPTFSIGARPQPKKELSKSI